ncbi:hypothetical protein BCV70DRAFT_66458 [Testicularia cyperi]|uniref:Uncharacterized protein n=1 Tax=Testicularia cyperi TaxID=1882483 RepID=A0A317XIT6_9BASI|nr:hypothetical protein BCV70DRAFT_66458 [Testicularia cyperi]
MDTHHVKKQMWPTMLGILRLIVWLVAAGALVASRAPSPETLSSDSGSSKSGQKKAAQDADAAAPRGARLFPFADQSSSSSNPLIQGLGIDLPPGHRVGPTDLYGPNLEETFLSSMTYVSDGQQHLRLPTNFFYEPGDASLTDLVQTWNQGVPGGARIPAFRAMKDRMVANFPNEMLAYFHTDAPPRIKRVFTRAETTEGGRNYLVTYHKKSTWSKSVTPIDLIAVWSGRNRARELVLRGLYIPGYDWDTADGHPLFLTWDRETVPGRLDVFKLESVPGASLLPLLEQHR